MFFAGLFILSFIYKFTNASSEYISLFQWNMFTGGSRVHSDMLAEARDFNNKKIKIDLKEEFPAVWDSGPAYQRDTFKKNQKFMNSLANTLCIRHRNIKKISFFDLRYKIKIGEKFDPSLLKKGSLVLKANCSNYET